MMFLDILISRLNESIFEFPEALEYLYSRDVTDEEIRKYKIGYSTRVKIPGPLSEDRSRMVEECKNGRKLDRKVIFPYIDASGLVVGLVGRSIETKVFKIFMSQRAKIEGCFFGLDSALFDMYNQNRVFVVEGPFDAVAMKKVFLNTVATVTSAISIRQLEYLRFYCDLIIVVFDTDEAGRKGREKVLEYDGVVSMDLKNYKDPAECLEKLGLKEFKNFITKQLPLF